jgi:hypothetical protein
MLRASIVPRRANADILDEPSVREVLADLPPRLLAYRLRNYSRVEVPKIDVDFPTPIREIARSLSAVIVDDTALRTEVMELLRPQAEDVRAQQTATPEFALVVAVLAYLHQRDKKYIPVNVLATAANAVLRSFGEIVEYSPSEIGFRLASLGLYTTRTTNAKVLRLDRDTSRKAHELARRLGVPLPEKGFPDCPGCGSPARAAENKQVLQGVQGM